jgi:hypothetical protein
MEPPDWESMDANFVLSVCDRATIDQAVFLGSLNAMDFDFDPSERENAANAMVRISKEHSVDLVCLGPLTNVAIAVKLDSTFLSRLNSLTIMGKILAAQLCCRFFLSRIRRRNYGKGKLQFLE